MQYLLLGIAIVAELIGTTFLKYSDGRELFQIFDILLCSRDQELLTAPEISLKFLFLFSGASQLRCIAEGPHLYNIPIRILFHRDSEEAA